MTFSELVDLAIKQLNSIMYSTYHYSVKLKDDPDLLK